jgi:ATP-binding cassette subfamily B multidrug efflux pump
MSLFAWFDSRLPQATSAPPPEVERNGPPPGLVAFYAHFVRQARGLFAAMFVTGLVVALIDLLIPVFIGRLVGLMAAEDRAAAFTAQAPWLAAIAATVLIARPLAFALDSMVRNNAVIPGVTTLIRWQSHWHVIRQPWSFFQNDFAGRIANRVMNTANSLRESVVSSIRAVWYIVVYGTATLAILVSTDARLALPMALWVVGYLAFLRYFVPRMRDLSRISSEARSQVMGRVVDSYTNFPTVKLFARAADEDAYVREAMVEHREKIAAHMRMTTRFMFTLACLNSLLIVGTAAIGLTLWLDGAASAALVATALPLAWQIANMAGWVSWEVSSIFENIGVVQEGMETIAVPHALTDAPQARPLAVSRGAIDFDRVRFGYGQLASGGRAVLDDLTLQVAPGERVGLVGRSGAGKSTLVSLLLRFHDVEGGAIRIDGQDLRQVTQESLRSAIGVVTQDTSMLHRSIAANIRYGRPQASDAEVEAAARRAHAHEFIMGLRDWKDRSGYDAHAGERGVKLSGGQRQRVALARVILKDSPILVLDEATSALDSEIEAAIQEQFESLMTGKTVIAIAHRLSTIARMDRLVVMDGGRIVEEGTHEQLLASGGHYAQLWKRQSGGFLGLDEGEPPAVEDEPELLDEAGSEVVADEAHAASGPATLR